MPTDRDSTEPMARCRHFRLCGGCTRLTTAMSVQSARHDSAFSKLLGPRLPAGPFQTVSPPAPATGWRTKLIYMVGQDREGLPMFGLYAKDSHRIVRISECAIQDPVLTTYALRAEAAVRNHRMPVHRADGQTIQPGLRAFWLRHMPGTRELLAGLVCSSPLPLPDGLTNALSAAAAELPTTLVGLAHIRNDSPGNRILSDEVTTIEGRLHQFDHEDGLDLRYHLTSFRQAHKDAARLLYAPALSLLGDLSGQTVVDGYGGVGAFALRLARLSAHVTLVETHPAAAEDAIHNAATNALQIKILQAPFAQAELPPRPDLLVLDPPRSGVRPEGIARILALDPERILHVACGPQGLVADLDLLLDRYRVQKVIRIDLFPHTEHSEAVLLLERR